MTKNLTSRHKLIRLLGIVFVTLLLATACGSDSDVSDASSAGVNAPEIAGGEDSAESGNRSNLEAGIITDAMSESDGSPTTTIAGDDDAGAAEVAVEATAQDPADQDLGGGTEAPINFSAADIGRDIIFTAQISVGVDDVQTAGRQASEIIESVGGFVFGQNTVGGNEARSEITFKVLPERFDEALSRLGEIGELRNQSISADDVTERIVDLDSRIRVAELGVDRLRTALENATDLSDYAEIERLLLNRESDLEVMRGQIRTLQDRVALATITLTLSQEVVSNSIDLKVTAYEGHDGGLSCAVSETGLSVEANTPATICFEVRNTGDQTLTDVTITDTVLDITAETDLISVFDGLDELAPNESAVVAFEVTPERTIRPRPRVTALPSDGVNAEPSGPAVSTVANFEIRTFVPEIDEDPGFGDGFDTAKDLLLAIWTVITVLAGFLLLPLLIVFPIAWVLWRLVRPRAVLRREERRARIEERYEATRRAQPNPPAPDPVSSSFTQTESD